MSETATAAKAKTGDKAGWVKRNLKADVRGGAPPSAALMKLVGAFGARVGAADYQALPADQQLRLSAPVHAMIDAQDEAGAQQALQAFDAALATAAKAHYEQQRQRLAKDEEAVRRIGDEPAYLTGPRDAAIASAKRVTDAAGVPDYAAALAGLGQLRSDLEAALALSRRAGVERETSARCAQIKAELGATVQVGGKDTPVCKAVGTKAWRKAVDKIVASKLDDDFTARYDAACDAVVEKLSNDPIIQDAAKQWKSWTADYAANEAKIKAAMQQILKTQSEALGWPTPTAAPYIVDDGNEGYYSSQPYPPGKLAVNFTSAGARDFRELMDTLTHENTHAYQEKLIRGLRAGTIKPGDPDFAAATTLEMNDTGGTTPGYIDADASGAYSVLRPGRAYMKQPCEAHAWAAGRRIGRTVWANLKKQK